jgi:hypothetical protein
MKSRRLQSYENEESLEVHFLSADAVTDRKTRRAVIDAIDERVA